MPRPREVKRVESGPETGPEGPRGTENGKAPREQESGSASQTVIGALSMECIAATSAPQSLAGVGRPVSPVSTCPGVPQDRRREWPASAADRPGLEVMADCT